MDQNLILKATIFEAGWKSLEEFARLNFGSSLSIILLVLLHMQRVVE